MDLTLDQFKELYLTFKKKIQDQAWPSKELYRLNKILADLNQHPDLRKQWTKEFTEYFNMEFLFGFTQRLVSQKTISSQDVILSHPST